MCVVLGSENLKLEVSHWTLHIEVISLLAVMREEKVENELMQV